MLALFAERIRPPVRALPTEAPSSRGLADATLTATTLPAKHVTAPARSESQAAVAHRTGVRGRQGRAWAGSLRGPLLRGWNHHVSMVRFASRLSSPSAPGLFPPRPEKPPRGKRRIVTTVRTAARPERHFRDSFITVRLAVARVLATWLPRCPCVTDRDRWHRLVHMPVNTDGRLPF